MMWSWLSYKSCFACERPGAWICQHCLEHITWCQKESLSFITYPSVTHIYSVVEYRDSVEKLVNLVKQGRYYSLIELWVQLTFIRHPRLIRKNDILLPVSTTFQRRMERGFSPTENFAFQLAEHTGSQVSTNILTRKKDETHQANKNREKRLASKQNFFLQNVPKKNTVWIIDDVITTGSTVGDCARALGEQGLSCKVLTFATTQ